MTYPVTEQWCHLMNFGKNHSIWGIENRHEGGVAGQSRNGKIPQEAL